MARTSTFAAIAIAVVVLSSTIGVAGFYSQPAKSRTYEASTLSNASTLSSFNS